MQRKVWVFNYEIKKITEIQVNCGKLQVANFPLLKNIKKEKFIRNNDFIGYKLFQGFINKKICYTLFTSSHNVVKIEDKT
jgi:hypothetical protein